MSENQSNSNNDDKIKKVNPNKKNKKVSKKNAAVNPVRVGHAIRRTVISLSMLFVIAVLISYAPNYVVESKTEMPKLIINNNNITRSLKNEIVKVDGEYYLSTDDLKNFFDEYLIKTDNEVITTSDTKTAKLTLDSNTMYLNGQNVNCQKLVNQNSKMYISLKDAATIYNLEYKINEKKNNIVISSLNRKLVQGESKKTQYVKYMATNISRDLEKIKAGEKFYISQENGSDVKIKDWVRIRTEDGVIGYIKESNIVNEKDVREDAKYTKINGKVSLVWDYYTQYNSAPTRTEKIDGVNAVSPSFYELKKDGTIAKNINEASRKYIEWAHSNSYQVWPTLSNSFLNNLDAVSAMMQTFETRSKLIDNIVQALTESDVDGVNIDFENMYKEDKDKYSRFIIELTPRLRAVGKTVVVDVTAPDGSDTWSQCYDRNTLGKVADYLVFIGYDQHNASSKEAGSVDSSDWVELNIKKFLGQEGVSKDKLIVAMPFYTRLWRETNGKVKSTVVNMKDIMIPYNLEKTWDDTAKQYYIEYQKDGSTYKMWIEDATSISARIDLINKYGLKGAGFWEKDRETADIWAIVKEKLQ